ncbi:Calcium permeable stress-gated cation channel 1 [Lecanosticta acicola]|uniref:Calcium permeable stress-gated cation channel 1 n=1 Tax=Lecanosticta acicola TaxID=111012 RepID=A0AAI8YTB2_9PEZI|nr:Calcium permeable stress-gated cation channel 1 [Lecanosticta acicola]
MPTDLLDLFLKGDDGDDDHQPDYSVISGASNPRATTIQILLSLALGVGAFLAFCILRPRWPGLYAARKKQKCEATVLPELPDTLFGWIMPLWRINDQQLLASAGLDAYVFLAFFKMAMKFLIMTLFFSLIVIKPVHDAYPDNDDDDDDGGHNETDAKAALVRTGLKRSISLMYAANNGSRNDTSPYVPLWPGNLETDYLWMYVVFAYLFSAIAVYLIISTTRRVIEVRQEYLGAQTTVTDRTIRLSGIPKHLQDEDKIKEFIEDLDIGKVENVVLCRNWKELDKAMKARMDILRRLEEAYTIYHGYRRVERNHETLPISQPPPPAPHVEAVNEGDETATLIGANGDHVRPYAKARPQATIGHGFLGFKRQRVDAIDYYEEKLRKADEQLKQLRAKEYPPMPLAFVTLDSVAACQMAMQAVLDPSPLQLIANQSPEPADVIWPNTYLTRRNRMVRAWMITALIILLTVFWSAILVPIAGLLNVTTIAKVFPGLANILKNHANIRALINTQLPTLISSLLVVLVPYLYYYLSWFQGMISQGDIELSAISKNFFFVFFNFFIIFTVLGTASNFLEIFDKFGEAIRDIQNVARAVALSLQTQLPFYTNLVILQGVGLFPLRLLEVGSVSLYPIMLLGAKTPRDYAELVQPPTFCYGFYLPNALLIFIICMVYSVIRNSWQVLLAGFLYFALGHFCYKYQLLYAMDHRQQTSGRAWGMICDRIFVGLIFFQLTTAGQLILQKAFARAALVVPLTIATFWISIVYGKTYKPLMKFIALSSVRRGEHQSEQDGYRDDPNPEESYAPSLSSTNLAPERNVWGNNSEVVRRVRREVGEQMRFINPSLVAPLGKVWIAGSKDTDGIARNRNASPEVVEEEHGGEGREEDV